MNFIFFRDGTTDSLIPILTLIEHKRELIVGCILFAEGEPPNWFIDSVGAENPAQKLLDCADSGQVLTALDVFLIVKEPNSLLQFTVLAAIFSCNLNYSGQAGRGGRTLLQYLAKYNIPTYPADIKKSYQIQTKSHRTDAVIKNTELIKKDFWYAFNVVASTWLPATWGVEPVRS